MRPRKVLFAQALREAIAACGKTERQVSAEIGVPYSTVRKWCCGLQAPNLGRVALLVRVTGDPAILEAYLQEEDLLLARRVRGARRRRLAATETPAAGQSS